MDNYSNYNSYDNYSEDEEKAMRELKTKCHNCKGKLYQGNFIIWGFSAHKYCTMECAKEKNLSNGITAELGIDK